jgi:hypothetical protein
MSKGRITVTVELNVDQAQELLGTAETKVKQIDWVLENKPPKEADKAKLDTRAKLLTLAATVLRTALNERAKAESNIIKMSGKK